MNDAVDTESDSQRKATEHSFLPEYLHLWIWSNENQIYYKDIISFLVVCAFFSKGVQPIRGCLVELVDPLHADWLR